KLPHTLFPYTTLFRSNVIDILFGSQFKPEWTFRHAQHDVPENERYTAVFDDFVEGINDKHVLLDHILLSPGLTAGGLRKVPESGDRKSTRLNSSHQII